MNLYSLQVIYEETKQVPYFFITPNGLEVARFCVDQLHDHSSSGTDDLLAYNAVSNMKVKETLNIRVYSMDLGEETLEVYLQIKSDTTSEYVLEQIPPYKSVNLKIVI